MVMLGRQGAGKGTQCVRLSRHYVVPHISTGDMLRAAVASGSPLGQRVEAVLASGKLVDDETMADVVRERLSQGDTAEGFLLDGYPRTFPQAETLTEILDKRGDELDDVFLIEAPTAVLVERALARGREDDREEIVRERLEVYRRQTEPLVAVYDRAGILRRIDGNQTIEEVEEQILATARVG